MPGKTGSGISGGNEGGSEKGAGEGVEKILAVLHRGGDVGANLGEPTGTRKGAKAAGDFLLDLEHAKVAFGQVVGEGDTEVDHEGEDALLVEFQPGEKVLGLGFLGPSPAFRTGFGTGIFRPSPGDQIVVAGLQEDEFFGGENGLALPVTIGGGEDVLEKESEGTGPGLPQHLLHEHEFPTEMGVAQTMGDVEGEVGSPAVVNEPPPEAGEEVELGEGDSSPVRMDPVPGQRGRGEDMEPGERALDPDSGLVRMGKGGLEELLFEGKRKRVERLVGVDNDLLKGGGADRGPEEILAHPGETVEGDKLVDMGVGQPSFDVRAVLDRNGRLRRKGSLDRFTAAGTAPDGTTVFGRQQLLGRKIQNLSRGNGQVGFRLERSGISAEAPLRIMDDDPVRRLDRGECLSGMPLLPSRLSVRGRTKTLGLGLAIAVRGRGLARVPAVFRNLGFQGADARQKILNLGLQGQNDVDKDKGIRVRDRFKLFAGKDPKRGRRGSRRYLGILRGGGGHVVVHALTLSDRTESVQSPEIWVREKTPE